MQGRSHQSFSPGTLLRAFTRILTSYRASKNPALPGSANLPGLGLDLLKHELRTPLSGILGMCELLQSSGLTGEQRQFACAVEESGQQLLRLIAGFGANASLAVRDEPAVKHALNGPILMEQVVRAHWPEAHRKGIGLLLEYDHHLPARWYSDISCLRQLLDNLLANAIKFTQQGYVRVEVRRSQLSASGRGDIELKVYDTGIGIAHGDAGRIYSIREQGSGDIGQRFGGSGLGLYVCSRLVSRLGGCIMHTAAGNGGTCFSVELPDVADPGPDCFDRLQPGLLKDMKCALAMRPPLVGVLQHLLLRMGVQVTVNPRLGERRIPEGFDTVICDSSLLSESTNGVNCGSGWDKILLLSHPYSSSPATINLVRGIDVTELPQPILRSNLEPFMLRLALQRKLQSQAFKEG